MILMASWCTAAVAQDCTYQPNYKEGYDAYYSGLWKELDVATATWSCGQKYIEDMWDRFDFDKEDWDNGFGYSNPCDLDLPLGRTFNALMLLAYGVQGGGTCTPDGNPNFAVGRYCWAGNELDELDGRCGSGSASSGTRAHTEFFPVIADEYTELYWPFFYGESVVERAATIVHEARHAHGLCQHEGNCPRGGSSCDPSYEDGCVGFGSGSGKGCNAYQVLYLSWFAYSARDGWITQAIRDHAVFEANTILARAFEKDPCFRLASDGTSYMTC